MCLITSLAAARERGETQKMVLLEITGVAGDGTVSVQVTAWNNPR